MIKGRDAETNTRSSPYSPLASIWTSVGGSAKALEHVDFTGADPVLPSSFRVGTAAQVSIGAAALAAAELHRQRTGIAQRTAVDILHAAIECRSERYFRVNGAPAPDPWDPLAGAYQCGDGRWVRLHTNFPHHRDGVLRLLKCEGTRDAVAGALLSWRAADFEAAATEARMVVAMMRPFEEWDAHPQAAVVSGEPLIKITRLGDATPPTLPPGARPLEGVRVMELTRIIAGPVCGRTLALHGAELLRIIGPELPTVEAADIDTGRGKRSAFLGLSSPEDITRMRGLIGEADIFLQSYRPGALAARGFSPQEIAALRPGIVIASLSAYGTSGPWSGKRGFDSLVQTATGFNAAEAEAAGSREPRALPMQILDHASGYLLAMGAICALSRRVNEGGSWHVEVSLARTGHWLRGLGRVPGGLRIPDIGAPEAAAHLETSSSGYGTLAAIRHAAYLSITPATFTRPSVPYGTDQPSFL
jgi:crotonobetainyl-CoA:carnitine CoA-transferase CaiB-like acyl-CoA transferase